MDEEIAIINQNTRNQKIKGTILKYKKSIYIFIFIIIISIFFVFFYKEYQKKNYNNLTNKFNYAITNYNKGDKELYIKEFKEIINTHNKTYAPLSLFFIIDNKLIESKIEVNQLFDQIIDKANLENQIRELMIYKKALFNADDILENELVKILNPVINSKSIWKPHSLLLLGDYFLSKGEKEKAKDFFMQILSDEKSNQNIIFQSQQRMRINF